MQADREPTRAIGTLLVESNRLDFADVQEIQAYAQKSGLRFGDAAIRLNFVTKEDIEFALARQFNYTLLCHGTEGPVSDEVIAAYNPQCATVEDLRTLRSRLMLGWLGVVGRNVLAITSSERQEGRTWLAANLATVFAQSGKRTLLIDADMRQPRQHELFNMDNNIGLSEALTGRAGREIAQRVHPNLRLFVATAGRVPPNPQELLARRVFEVVLDTFAKQFDIVIVDTPAVVDSADAEILGARAGAALLIARRNQTLQKRLTATMSSLVRSGVKIIGSVMTDF